MENEANVNPNPTAGQAQAAASDDPRDEGLDLQNLPAPPWSHRALGDELYGKLARVGGYFDPRTMPDTYRPDLDPRSFAQGRYNKRKLDLENEARMRASGIEVDEIFTPEKKAEFVRRAGEDHEAALENLKRETAAIHEQVYKAVGPVTGTPLPPGVREARAKRR